MHKLIHYLLFLPLLFLISSCGAPDLKNIDQSDHFDGNKFFLPGHPRSKKKFMKILKWRFDKDKKALWPTNLKKKNFPLPQKRNNINELSVTFINHATCLIQIGGTNIITDPIWSLRASPVSWAGPKRARPPGLSFKDLPPIDVILISHNHFDHMDTQTIERIAKRDSPKILFGHGSSYYLKKNSKKQAIELDWNESIKLNDTTFTFLPSRHWSKRTFNDTNKSLWGAFVVENKKHKIYFAGDTGYSEHFKKASEKFGSFDLSLIPIGAYEPRWFMKESHINPEDALKAHLDLKSKFSIGIHHRTFQLTDEAIDAPVNELNKLITLNPPTFPFIYLEEGQSKKIL